MEFVGKQDSWKGKSTQLELEAFILQGTDKVVFTGTLEMKSVEGEVVKSSKESDAGRVRTRITYALPGTLRPGSYRLLARASDAEAFFIDGKHMCDAPIGATSRWIKIEIDR